MERGICLGGNKSVKKSCGKSPCLVTVQVLVV